ncbi:MAG: NUDIX domain-containing protein [Pseudomonadota bacterium]
MMQSEITALNWLAALRAEAQIPPLRPRVPLWAGKAGGGLIGSVESGFMHQMAVLCEGSGHGRLLAQGQFTATDGAATEGWFVRGDVTTSLNQLAALMSEAGLAGAWRNEQLAVCDTQGQRLGTVERAAVRPLGIRTLAVHLVGLSPDGRFWVQQRAFDKANDPGLWDTLMGGMVSAADTTETALARETWEEAGLNVSKLQQLHYGGSLTTRRPAHDGGGAGYVVEQIDWYCCTVPEGLVPDNQDGEVEKFCLMDSAQLLGVLQNSEFTLEAALILAAVMGLGE